MTALENLKRLIKQKISNQRVKTVMLGLAEEIANPVEVKLEVPVEESIEVPVEDLEEEE